MDTMKVRLQARGQLYTGMLDCFTQVILARWAG
jgi:hypothetical protein